MPIIHIEIVEGRTEEKIQKMMTEVTDAVERTLACSRQNIRVIVTEIPKNHFAIGGKTAKELGR